MKMENSRAVSSKDHFGKLLLKFLLKSFKFIMERAELFLFSFISYKSESFYLYILISVNIPTVN